MSNELVEKLRSIGCDTVGAVDRFLGDEDVYADFIIKYRDKLRIAEFERLVAEKNYKAAFECVHDIKGVTGNLGLTPMYEVACLVTEALRNPDKRDETAVASLCARLAERYEEFMRASSL